MQRIPQGISRSNQFSTWICVTYKILKGKHLVNGLSYTMLFIYTSSTKMEVNLCIWQIGHFQNMVTNMTFPNKQTHTQTHIQKN